MPTKWLDVLGEGIDEKYIFLLTGQVYFLAIKSSPLSTVTSEVNDASISILKIHRHVDRYTDKHRKTIER